VKNQTTGNLNVLQVGNTGNLFAGCLSEEKDLTTIKARRRDLKILLNEERKTRIRKRIGDNDYGKTTIERYSKLSAVWVKM